MWQEILTALGLVLVIEGMLPFLRPDSWREAVRKVAQMDDRTLRITGLVCMVCGVLLVYAVR